MDSSSFLQQLHPSGAAPFGLEHGQWATRDTRLEGLQGLPALDRDASLERIRPLSERAFAGRQLEIEGTGRSPRSRLSGGHDPLTGLSLGATSLPTVGESPDYAASTSTLASLAVGASTTGVVDFLGDRDWFRISLTAGMGYRFNLNGNTLADPTLSLRDSAGAQLASNDDSNGTRNSEIYFTPTTTGNYYLDAGGFNGENTGTYTLLAATADDYSANTATTGSVAVGGSATGVVNTNDDRDWFRVSLTAGRNYRFNLNGNTLSDPDLYLRDSAGTQIFYNDDSNGTNNSQIAFTPGTTGTYYLDAGGFSAFTGSYNLVATDLSPADDYSASASTTGTVAPGGSTTGVVNFNGDRDWFRIALTAGNSYRFNLNGNTLADATLYLRDAAGAQLAFNDDSNGTNNSEIAFTATTTGTYYLDAGDFSTSTGTYTLLATNTTPPDDYSANSSTTGSVAAGGSASGVVNFNGDRDWFRVSLTAGRDYRFNLNGNTLSDPDLYLRDSAGIQISYSDDSNGTNNSQIAFTPATTGTYYLDAGGFSTFTGSYNLLATDLTPVDDYSASASTTGTVAPGGSTTGVVNFNGDRDWFRVALTAGRSYILSVNGTTLTDPTLYLRDSLGNQLAFNDDYNGLYPQISYVASSSANYYLDVGAYSDLTGTYSVLVTDTTPADDYGATTLTTGTVAVGGSSTGIVNSNADRDWFRVSLTQGRTYRFNLNGNTLSDPTLYLRDSLGAQLAYNDDTNGLNSEVTFVATATGNFYLDAGGYGSGTGSYTISATDTSPTDDYSNTTSTTGTVAIGGSSTGVVNTSEDRDWFRLSLTAGVTYRFNLDGTTLSDPNLYLRDSAGNQLSYNDDFSGLNSQITFTAATTGVYYLDAGGYGSATGSYTIAAVSTSALPTTDDYSANTSTTGSLVVGATSRGVIEIGNDSDWFRISLEAGNAYRFNLTGNTLTDTFLYLRDAAGTALESNDDIAVNNVNSQIAFTAVTSGTYYLDAQAYGSLTGSYTIGATLVSTPVPTTDDYAGSSATTGTVTVGNTTRSGVINSNGDRDWFGVSLNAGRTYRFVVTGSTLFDPEVYLRSSTGEQVAYADDSNGSRNPSLAFTIATTGVYYLDVGSFNNVGVGAYTVQAIDQQPADDYTANTATTGRVAIGGSRTGVVNAGGDRDWFQVSLTAGTSYRFNVTGTTLADPNLYLLDASGNTLLFSDDYNGLNPQIGFTPTSSGLYYLDVGAASASAVGSYTVLAASVARQSDDYAGDTTTTGRLSVGRSVGGTIEFSGDRDWYQIALTGGRSYQFNLDGVSLSDPALRLYDGTGGTLLANNDDFGGGRNSQITFAVVNSGNYYLDAGAVGSLLGTYNLSVTDVTTDTDRIAGLQDTTIRQAVNTALGDNLFSKAELSTILRNAGVSGVTSTELSDFRIIGNNLSPYLSATTRDYLVYIFNAVVNSNTANQWWTGGASSRVALGNLVAGSTELQLTRLVDKWFGGLDLPANFVGGDSAAGAGSLSFTYTQMTGSLFVNDVNYDDINQGQAGTCYYLASLASLAISNRQVIRDLFRDNGDGTYGVHFYSNTGNDVWVTVNRSVPVVGSAMALASNSSRSLSGEMWVALAEKAYAQANETGAFGRSSVANSYRAVEGGWEDALRHLSGLSTTGYSAYYNASRWSNANNSLTTWNTYRNAALTALNSGRSLWVASFEDSYDSSGKRNFVGGHAQSIIGYNPSTGNFIIANPWGAGGSGYAPTYEASWQTIFNVKGVVCWS